MNDAGYRIFASDARFATGPARPARDPNITVPTAPPIRGAELSTTSTTPTIVVAKPKEAIETRTTIEDQILQILEEAAPCGESLQSTFARKERELCCAFTTLTSNAANDLARRLAELDPKDRVAAAFGRLAAERRARLVAFLEDAPRRAAVSGGRR